MTMKGGGKLVANQKVTGRAVSFPAGLAMGVGVCVGVTVAMAALTAWMESNNVIAENGVGYCIMLTLLLSSMAGALTAAGKIKRKRLASCMICGICYFFILFAITALFFGGQYSGVGVTGLVILGGSAAAVFIGGKGKRSTSVRIKKIKNR